MFPPLLVGGEDKLDPFPFEHWLTHDPHPEGIPLHVPENGGKKQDPIVSPFLTWQL